MSGRGVQVQWQQSPSAARVVAPKRMASQGSSQLQMEVEQRPPRSCQAPQFHSQPRSIVHPGKAFEYAPKLNEKVRVPRGKRRGKKTPAILTFNRWKKTPERLATKMNKLKKNPVASIH